MWVSNINRARLGPVIHIIGERPLVNSDGLRGEVWAHKTSLALPLFIDVPVPSKKSERSCICELGVSILSLSTTLIFDFDTNFKLPPYWKHFTIPFNKSSSLQFLFRLFTKSPFLNYEVKQKTFFGRYRHLVLISVLLHTYRWQKVELATGLLLNSDYYFSNMSYDAWLTFYSHDGTILLVV
jgi:hypothetical protein